MLISVVGTLISDNLTDHMGVPLEASTTVFAIVRGRVARWYRASGPCPSTTSTPPAASPSTGWRSCSTFALGTAAGDLVSERVDLGHWLSAVLFAMAIAAVAIAHFALDLDAAWSFRSLLPRPARWAPRSATTSPSPPAMAASIWAPS